MAITTYIYNSFKKSRFTGVIDFLTDDIKVMLTTSAYTPDVDSHQYISDVTGEVVGTGYTAGGKSLTGKTVTQDNTNDLAHADCDPITWSTSTITARRAVVYKNTGVAGTSPVIGCIDFGDDRTTSATDFTINPNALGLLRQL